MISKYLLKDSRFSRKFVGIIPKYYTSNLATKKAISRLKQPVAGDSPRINGNEPMYEPYTQPPTIKQKVYELTDVTELDKMKDNQLSQVFLLVIFVV